jgi:hypothetical protein
MCSLFFSCFSLFVFQLTPRRSCQLWAAPTATATKRNDQRLAASCVARLRFHVDIQAADHAVRGVWRTLALELIVLARDAVVHAREVRPASASAPGHETGRSGGGVLVMAAAISRTAAYFGRAWRLAPYCIIANHAMIAGTMRNAK